MADAIAGAIALLVLSIPVLGIRMLLVPATMELLGDKNWWMPRWLDKTLPKVNVEGSPEGTEERELERV